MKAAFLLTIRFAAELKAVDIPRRGKCLMFAGSLTLELRIPAPSVDKRKLSLLRAENCAVQTGCGNISNSYNRDQFYSTSGVQNSAAFFIVSVSVMFGGASYMVPWTQMKDVISKPSPVQSSHFIPRQKATSLSPQEEHRSV
jgi:hypothetical protein